MSAELPVVGSCHDPKDYKSELKPIWCPGCGDFGVLQALYRALAAIGRPPHEIAFISGIGCSSRIPGYTTAYGFNTVHGRALPIAQGIKAANPDLLVIGAGGDGDGFSIGGGHLPHAIRRNLDLTYIVMDNQIYGLTKGQLSPTSKLDLRTVTSPYGALEAPVNPLLYTLAYGAGFVAQSTPADMPGLTQVIEEAIRYPGFSFVNVQSPCVTFGEDDWQVKQHRAAAKPLASLGHDPTDLLAAMDKARAYGHELHTGVFYKNPSPPPTLDALLRERQRELGAQARQRDGEDIVQTLYARWWRRLMEEPGWKLPETHAELFVSVRRVVIDVAAKEKRDRARDERAISAVERDALDESLHAFERLRWILAHLPAPLADALTASLSAGRRDDAAVAAELGVTVSTFTARLFKARRAAEELASYYDLLSLDEATLVAQLRYGGKTRAELARQLGIRPEEVAARSQRALDLLEKSRRAAS